eukprot:s1500_g3.t1
MDLGMFGPVEDQVQVCSGMQNDVCGCLEAGCVAQEVSDSIACFAAYQPAAGGQIFAQDVHSECGKGNLHMG